MDRIQRIEIEDDDLTLIPSFPEVCLDTRGPCGSRVSLPAL